MNFVEATRPEQLVFFSEMKVGSSLHLNLFAVFRIFNVKSKKCKRREQNFSHSLENNCVHLFCVISFQQSFGFLPFVGLFDMLLKNPCET